MNKDRWLWQGALFCFILAGATGLLYRTGMVAPIPGGLSLDNLRHAHSHLMFFGWAVPLPMYLLWRRMARRHPDRAHLIRRLRTCIAWGLGLGLLSWPFFLLYGYRPVYLGGITLPLSVIISGAVMVSWYAFMAIWWKLRRGPGDRPGLLFMDSALLLLLVSSLGAWGVALAQNLAPATPLLSKALTHFFLACFAEGWVVLAALAVMAEAAELRAWTRKRWLALPVTAIVLGAPLTFIYGISEDLLSPLMLGIGRLGGAVAGLGLLALCHGFWQRRGGFSTLLLWPLAFLTLKGFMQLAASVVPGDFLLANHALRILYLHVLLLGAFTLAGAAALHLLRQAPYRSYDLLAGSVLAVLLSLLLLTPAVPAGWTGMWTFRVLAAAAALPVLAMMWIWALLARATPGDVGKVPGQIIERKNR
ncbi:MAG: hypothetical protein U5K31_13630 [Balneolaceae bacterium]|nr:hypothetical protein [Balneolaceae bacterium]